MPAAGENPKYGAALHVYVPESWAASEKKGEGNGPSDEKDDDGDGSADQQGADEKEADEKKEKKTLVLRVRDVDGKLVRELDDIDAEAGLRRFHWDLRGEDTTEVELLTPPAENPELPMPDNGKRRLADGGRVSVLEPPGVYRVELVAGDRILAGHDLRVLADPSSDGTEADLTEQLELARRLREGVDVAARTINQVEDLRAQLAALGKRAANGDSAHVDQQSASIDTTQESATQQTIAPLEAELVSIENELFDLRMTSASQDTLRWRRKLYARLTDLFRRVHQTTHRPTDQHRAVAALLLEQLEAVRARYRQVLEAQIPALETRLREEGLAGLSTPALERSR